MRTPINGRNGELRGSILTTTTPGLTKNQLLDRNGALLGYAQNGRSYDRNGNYLGSADLLATLLKS